MGKGSKPRPLSVSKKQFDENFDRIFGKKVDDPEDETPIMVDDVCDAKIEYITIHNEPINNRTTDR